MGDIQNEPLSLKIGIDDIDSLIEIAERAPKCKAEMAVVIRAKKAMEEFYSAIRESQQTSVMEMQKIVEESKKKEVREPANTNGKVKELS